LVPSSTITNVPRVDSVHDFEVQGFDILTSSNSRLPVMVHVHNSIRLERRIQISCITLHCPLLQRKSFRNTTVASPFRTRSTSPLNSFALSNLRLVCAADAASRWSVSSTSRSTSSTSLRPPRPCTSTSEGGTTLLPGPLKVLCPSPAVSGAPASLSSAILLAAGHNIDRNNCYRHLTYVSSRTGH